MNATQIATEIINGTFTTAEMNQIIEAVKNAQRLGRARRSAIAITQMAVGITGTLTGLKPKSLNGTKVKVLTINRSRVEVQEVGNETWGGRYTVPAQCVIPD